jgi:hypothetical protein
MRAFKSNQKENQKKKTKIVFFLKHLLRYALFLFLVSDLKKKIFFSLIISFGFFFSYTHDGFTRCGIL